MMGLPLEDYRVLDFGTAWAGPQVGQVLADMGAEVIKVETRNRLDGLRLGRPIVGDDIAGGDEGKWPDMQPGFHCLNRNKLSITVDIKKSDGLHIIRNLVAVSDVVIDNSSPDTMAKLGLNHKSLESIKPDIISISLTGCGEYGPLKDVLAYAPSTIALGGFNSLVGYRGDDAVLQPSVPYGDSNASIHGAFAVVVALWHREKTGEGQHIEVSESDAVTNLLGEGIMEYYMNGRVMGTQGNYHPTMCPHGIYRCRGADKWISIAIDTDEEWRSFCQAIGEPEWVNSEQFVEKQGRLHNREELDRLVNEWTSHHSPYEAMEILQQSGVAAIPVMNVEDQFADPHFRDRQTFIEVEHPLVGIELLPENPLRLSKTPGGVRRHAPALGEHNDYVLGELLGLSPENIAELVEERVLY